MDYGPGLWHGRDGDPEERRVAKTHIGILYRELSLCNLYLLMNISK